jgi:hypothetical protein
MTLKCSNQLVDNDMEVYADIEDYHINQDQYNLFTLRADLHLNFDQGAFVFIPKSGQQRIHFLKRVRQSGVLYHDTLFNDHDRLARGFMLAHFGWAVIRLAKEHIWSPRAFDFSAEDDDENDDDEDGDGDEDGEDENNGGGSQEPICKKLKRSHTEKMPTRRSSRNKNKKKESHPQLEPEVIQSMLPVACIEYDTD